MSDARSKLAARQSPQGPIWWSNATFFVSMHIAAALGVYSYPLWLVPRQTLALCIISWQLASLGISIGYHRLWSHKSFTARRPLRLALAIMGALGFQGSIKWWCLRHRLHHRFTDNPVHDPYAATRGLLFAHVGWIFRKPFYERMSQIEKNDLEADSVVRFQHKFYIYIAVLFGLVAPTLVASLWSDAIGGFLYAGIVTRIFVWHCTFMINSLAHWKGLQPYTNEVTARGNLILAFLTSGEGNHNYHAFPHDFRNGPCTQDWDPAKWIIWALYEFTPFVTRVRRAREEDVNRARKWMSYIHAQDKDHLPYGWEELDDDLLDAIGKLPDTTAQSFEEWDEDQLETYIQTEHRLVVLIDSWVVDVTDYIKEHPGGSVVLKNHLYSRKPHEDSMEDATWAFNGGMNQHTRTARARMRSLRIARLVVDQNNC